MSGLVTGIVAFFVAALGALCPHHFVYVPALLAVIVAGGYVGGTIFSLQSEGVYDLRIRGSHAVASVGDVRLGGIWAYGLVGIPAGAIALLIAGRMVGGRGGAFFNRRHCRLGASYGDVPWDVRCGGSRWVSRPESDSRRE